MLRGRVFDGHSYRLQLFSARIELRKVFLRGGEVGGESLVWVAIWRLKWKLIETMSAKDILLEVAEKLPPEATLNDAIYELEFRQSVQQGLDELDRGEGIPIEQVKAKIVAWAGK